MSKNFISFFYKFVSRIFVLVLFSKKNQVLVKNYLIPFNLIKKYFFLYPCYKEVISEVLTNDNFYLLNQKSVIINPVNKVNEDLKKEVKYKSDFIYVIGNNLENVNKQLFETAVYLSNELKIKNILYRDHPRSNFKVPELNNKDLSFKKDHKELSKIIKKSLILTSYSSLTPYFLKRDFNVFLCKKSLLIEFKSSKKLSSYLKIYNKVYSNQKLKLI